MTAMESPQTTSILTQRFGEVTFEANDLIEFPWGLPGFAHLRRFLALTLDEQPNFLWLQSADDPTVALPAADPWQMFPDYEPKLPAYATAALELRNPDDFSLLCVVVVTKDAREMTMNLLAPIVINLKSRRARQVMLENSGYSVRRPVPRTAESAVAPG